MTRFLLHRMKETMTITTISRKSGVSTAMSQRLPGGVFTTATQTHTWGVERPADWLLVSLQVLNYCRGNLMEESKALVKLNDCHNQSPPKIGLTKPLRWQKITKLTFSLHLDKVSQRQGHGLGVQTAEGLGGGGSGDGRPVELGVLPTLVARRGRAVRGPCLPATRKSSASRCSIRLAKLW
ncbi:hypothetical protein EYF80_015782 [Liparis tanakae]|uniref:Uncharacterized protein n=1 Tax=Liparis tanakae TaxID=230148 RepID=A0A4Z2I828_9TELE|nr:hypothetical protein EYF80_015782 [Liparis tanakae]